LKWNVERVFGEKHTQENYLHIKPMRK
jgi:hypothetical protein